MSNVGQLNQQVDEVKGIVRGNIDKVVQRGERLDDLEGKAENLHAGAVHFEKTATKLKRKKKCQHLKLWLILISIIAVIVIVIIIIAAVLGYCLSADGRCGRA